MIPAFLEKYNRLQGQEKFVKTGHCNVLLLYIGYLLLGFEILLYPTPASKAFHCQDYQNSENIKHSRSWEILLEYCQKEKLCWGKLFDFSLFQTLLSRMKTIVQRVEVWINWIVFSVCLPTAKPGRFGYGYREKELSFQRDSQLQRHIQGKFTFLSTL